MTSSRECKDRDSHTTLKYKTIQQLQLLNIGVIKMEFMLTTIIAASQAIIAFLVWRMQGLATDRSTANFIGEKRQNWIDKIRDDVSEYLSLCLHWAYEYKGRDEKELNYCFKKTNELLVKIRLKLNFNEGDHVYFEQKLTELQELIENKQENLEVKNNIAPLIEELILLVRPILKKEWDRIKVETAFPKELINNIKREKGASFYRFTFSFWKR